MKISFNKAGSIIYILSLIAGLVFASFYGGSLPFLILYGLIFILIISIIYVILSYRALSIYQELDSHRLIKGEKHNYLLTLENTGKLPIHNIELNFHLDRCEIEEIKEGCSLSLEAFERKTIESKAFCLYGGTYDIGLKSIGYRDILGIFTVTVNIAYTFRAVVSPRISQIADPFLDIENTVNSIGIKSSLRREEIPGNEMRKYIPGDPLSRVNWKVSARLEDLMVRMPDKLDISMITLILLAVNLPESSFDREFLIRRDRFLEFAISSVWHFVRLGMPVDVIYPSDHITRTTISSYEEFMDFYNILSGAISYSSKEEEDKLLSLAGERREAINGYETSLIITEAPSEEEDFCVISS
ncbi:MAG: DUF58 domain-containing protein [Lachnospiraceae bacterium]|nr:DUF58 domain-containing protein [Lachnospiraceae bacterium]